MNYIDRLNDPRRKVLMVGLVIALHVAAISAVTFVMRKTVIDRPAPLLVNVTVVPDKVPAKLPQAGAGQP